MLRRTQLAPYSRADVMAIDDAEAPISPYIYPMSPYISLYLPYISLDLPTSWPSTTQRHCARAYPSTNPNRNRNPYPNPNPNPNPNQVLPAALPFTRVVARQLPFAYRAAGRTCRSFSPIGSSASWMRGGAHTGMMLRRAVLRHCGLDEISAPISPISAPISPISAPISAPISPISGARSRAAPLRAVLLLRGDTQQDATLALTLTLTRAEAAEPSGERAGSGQRRSGRSGRRSGRSGRASGRSRPRWRRAAVRQSANPNPNPTRTPQP